MMFFTAAVTFSLLAGLASTYPASGPAVRIKNGTYVGAHSSTYNQDYFLGIPYAQPPVGSLRFRNPVGLNHSWSGVKAATSYSSEVSFDPQSVMVSGVDNL
jgi:carboxylesterase type B